MRSLTYKLLIGFLGLTTLTTIGLGISTGVLSHQNGVIKERFKEQSLSLKECQVSCQQCSGGGDPVPPTPSVSCSNMYKISGTFKVEDEEEIKLTKYFTFGIENATTQNGDYTIEQVCQNTTQCGYKPQQAIIVDNYGRLNIINRYEAKNEDELQEDIDIIYNIYNITWGMPWLYNVNQSSIFIDTSNLGINATNIQKSLIHKVIINGMDSASDSQISIEASDVYNININNDVYNGIQVDGSVKGNIVFGKGTEDGSGNIQYPDSVITGSITVNGGINGAVKVNGNVQCISNTCVDITGGITSEQSNQAINVANTITCNGVGDICVQLTDIILNGAKTGIQVDNIQAQSTTYYPNGIVVTGGISGFTEYGISVESTIQQGQGKATAINVQDINSYKGIYVNNNITTTDTAIHVNNNVTTDIGYGVYINGNITLNESSTDPSNGIYVGRDITVQNDCGIYVVNDIISKGSTGICIEGKLEGSEAGMYVTGGITGSVSLGNVNCGSDGNNILSNCVTVGNIVSYLGTKTDGQYGSLKVDNITTHGGYGVEISNILEGYNGIDITGSVNVGGSAVIVGSVQNSEGTGVTIGSIDSSKDSAISVSGAITCGNTNNDISNACVSIGSVEAYIYKDIGPGSTEQQPPAINIGSITVPKSQALNVGGNIKCGNNSINIADNCVQIGDVDAHIRKVEYKEVEEIIIPLPAVSIGKITSNDDGVYITSVSSAKLAVQVGPTSNTEGSGIITKQADPQTEPQTESTAIVTGSITVNGNIKCGTENNIVEQDCVQLGDIELYTSNNDMPHHSINVGDIITHDGLGIVINSIDADWEALTVNAYVKATQGVAVTTGTITSQKSQALNVGGAIQCGFYNNTNEEQSISISHDCVSLSDITGVFNEGSQTYNSLDVGTITAIGGSSIGAHIKSITSKYTGNGIKVDGDINVPGAAISVGGKIDAKGGAISITGDINCGSQANGATSNNCVQMDDITIYGNTKTNAVQINSINAQSKSDGINVVNNVNSVGIGINVGNINNNGGVTSTSSTGISVSGKVKGGDQGVSVGSVESTSVGIYVANTVVSTGNTAIQTGSVSGTQGISVNNGGITATDGKSIYVSGSIISDKDNAIYVGDITCGSQYKDENDTGANISSNCVQMSSITSYSINTNEVGSLNVGSITSNDGFGIKVNNSVKVTANGNGIYVNSVSVEKGAGVYVESTVNSQYKGVLIAGQTTCGTSDSLMISGSDCVSLGGVEAHMITEYDTELQKYIYYPAVSVGKITSYDGDGIRITGDIETGQYGVFIKNNKHIKSNNSNCIYVETPLIQSFSDTIKIDADTIDSGTDAIEIQSLNKIKSTGSGVIIKGNIESTGNGVSITGNIISNSKNGVLIVGDITSNDAVNGGNAIQIGEEETQQKQQQLSSESGSGFKLFGGITGGKSGVNITGGITVTSNDSIGVSLSTITSKYDGKTPLNTVANAISVGNIKVNGPGIITGEITTTNGYGMTVSGITASSYALQSNSNIKCGYNGNPIGYDCIYINGNVEAYVQNGNNYENGEKRYAAINIAGSGNNAGITATNGQGIKVTGKIDSTGHALYVSGQVKSTEGIGVNIRNGIDSYGQCINIGNDNLPSGTPTLKSTSNGVDITGNVNANGISVHGSITGSGGTNGIYVQGGISGSSTGGEVCGDITATEYGIKVKNINAQNGISVTGSVTGTGGIGISVSGSVTGDIDVGTEPTQTPNNLEQGTQYSNIPLKAAPLTSAIQGSINVYGDMSCTNNVCVNIDGKIQNGDITVEGVNGGSIKVNQNDDSSNTVSIGEIYVSGSATNVQIQGECTTLTSTSIGTLTSTSIGTLTTSDITTALNVIYDAPAEGKDPTKVIEKIALYKSGDNTNTPTLTVSGITNTPSITGLTNGNVQINKITDESIEEIIISNINTADTSPYDVIGSIKLVKPNEVSSSVEISGIGNTFDIGTITTSGSIETLESKNINKDDCLTDLNNITLSPPPEYLTLVFNDDSSMKSIKIQDENNTDKFIITEISNSFNIKSISTSSNIDTISITGNVNKLTVNSIGSTDDSTSTALSVTNGITGGVSLGNVNCGNSTTAMNSSCVQIGNVITYGMIQEKIAPSAIYTGTITSYKQSNGIYVDGSININSGGGIQVDNGIIINSSGYGVYIKNGNNTYAIQAQGTSAGVYITGGITSSGNSIEIHGDVKSSDNNGIHAYNNIEGFSNGIVVSGNVKSTATSKTALGYGILVNKNVESANYIAIKVNGITSSGETVGDIYVNDKECTCPA